MSNLNTQSLILVDELISADCLGPRIGGIQVQVRHFPEASSINFQRPVRYGLETLVSLVKFVLTKANIYKAKIFIKNVK